MEIKEYKRIRGNEYEIILDNGSKINLYDDIIIKFELLLKKEITNKQLNEITKENDNLKAYYLSLKYLSKKMRSSLEIQKYLSKLDFDSKIINKTIEKLTKEKYLDNQKFIVSYINDQYNLTNNGPDKITQNLIKLGFKEDEININKDFKEKIKTLISKKNKINRKLTTNALKLNIANYLVNLGYPRDMFTEELEVINVNDNNLIKKDYEKIYRKYYQKYDSYKLKMVIKEKLYQKGYSIEAINELGFDDML